MPELEAWVNNLLIVARGQRLEIEMPCEEKQIIREIHLEAQAELKLVYRAKNLTDWQEQCRVHLVGEGSKIFIRGIMHAKSQSKLAYLLEVHHQAHHTESDIEFRGVAEDKGHIVFDGLIKVYEGIVGVNANEQNRNLLLSDQAIVEARPRLEIDTNEVVCRHGATVGDLNEDALFYLMSRGIPEQEARTMLIEAFFGFCS